MMNDFNDTNNVNSYHNNNGKFAPGNPGKPKGSSKNKMRDKIKSFIDSQWENFPQWFNVLKPAQKIETLMQLMPYAVARLQSISLVDSEGNDLEPRAKIDYSKLSESTLREILQHTKIDEEQEAQ